MARFLDLAPQVRRQEQRMCLIRSDYTVVAIAPGLLEAAPLPSKVVMDQLAVHRADLREPVALHLRLELGELALQGPHLISQTAKYDIGRRGGIDTYARAQRRAGLLKSARFRGRQCHDLRRFKLRRGSPLRLRRSRHA